MKRLSLLALCLLAGSAVAAPGITFPYQNHYACSWLLEGREVQSPDLYIAINKTSGAMTLQRPGFQVYYAKQLTPFTWQEINPVEGQAPERIFADGDGNLQTSQSGVEISRCIEVN